MPQPPPARTRQQQTLVVTEHRSGCRNLPRRIRTRRWNKRALGTRAGETPVALPEHRTIVLLRDFEGLSYDEIADVLQLESGTVKSRLHRARMELKALLEPYWAGEG